MYLLIITLSLNNLINLIRNVWNLWWSVLVKANSKTTIRKKIQSISIALLPNLLLSPRKITPQKKKKILNLQISSSVLVPSLHLLFLMQQKKKNDKSTNRFVSVPNLSALESSGVGNGHPNRLDPIPNSPIHDIEFNSSKPLPQPIPPKEPKTFLRWALPHQSFFLFLFLTQENFAFVLSRIPLALRTFQKYKCYYEFSFFT